MIEFVYPLFFLAIIFPVGIYYLIPEYKERRPSVQVPYFQRLVAISGKVASESAAVKQRKRLQWALISFGWLCVVTSMAKPQWVGEPIEQTLTARDLLVAVDLSVSMEEKDFTSITGEKVNRLEAVKEVLTEFAQTRKEDRLGLIVFADAAYLQTPFTDNINSWLALLNSMELEMAGRQTAIGDAIGLSIKVFENAKSDNKTLILLTDGRDTGSKMPPIKAAEIAAKLGIKIYTIAIGSPNTGGRGLLDLDSLEKISNLTGGHHYLAMDRTELTNIYQQIGELEKEEYNSISHRPRVSLHHYPLIGFMAVYLLAKGMSYIYRKLILMKRLREG